MAGILLNRSRQVPAEETPAFGGIAERFRRAGDLDRAIALCRDGLKRFPEQLSARVTLGWALLDKGQYDLARTELEQVLRKAPDNLAAIRGLAELHDRTEGALPPEDERSWKSEDTPAVAEAPAPAAAPVPERLAPIPVSLSNAAAEVLHTGADAVQTAEAAASAFEPAAGLSVAPVELEDPAAASMAAADPAPFFVVDPVETLAFDPGVSADAPVPFEVAGIEPVEVEIETPGAAALSAVDLAEQPGTVAADADELEHLALEATGVELWTEAPAPSADHTGHVLDEEIDWAGLASLTGDATVDVSPTLDALPTAIDEPSATLHAVAGDLESQADVTFDGLSSLDATGELVGTFGSIEQEPSAMFAAPEGLDDIDEIAGQELADAIKALEEAAKRVEARLAPAPVRNEPATSPEEIAAYDFGPAPGIDAADDSAPAPLLDTRQDGSFELVAPDMTDLSFGLEPSSDVTETSSDTPALPPLSDDTFAPAFDFDALPAAGFDGVLEAPATVDAQPASADIALEAIEQPAETVDVVAGAEDDSRGTAEAVDAAGTAASATSEVEGTIDLGLAAESAGSTLDVEPRQLAEVVETVEVAEVAEVTEAAETVEVTDVVAVTEVTDAVEVAEVAEVADVADVEVTDLVDVAEPIEPVEVVDAAAAIDVAPVADSLDAAAATGDAEPGDVADFVDVTDVAAAVVEVETSDAEREPEAANPADAADEALPLAALVATDLPAPTVIDEDVAPVVPGEPAITAPSFEPALADTAPVFAPEADAVPVMHVYDSPVLTAPAAAMAVADVLSQVATDAAPAAAPMMGQVQTSARAPLAALERFLRKVQARQLELRGQTVA